VAETVIIVNPVGAVLLFNVNVATWPPAICEGVKLPDMPVGKPVVTPCGTVVASVVAVTLVMTAGVLLNVTVVVPGPSGFGFDGFVFRYGGLYTIVSRVQPSKRPYHHARRRAKDRQIARACVSVGNYLVTRDHTVVTITAIDCQPFRLYAKPAIV